MITLTPICNEKEEAAALSANKTLIQYVIVRNGVREKTYEGPPNSICYCLGGPSHVVSREVALNSKRTTVIEAMQ